MYSDNAAAQTELGSAEESYESAVRSYDRAAKNYRFVMWFCVGATALWAFQRDRRRGYL